MFGLVAFGLVGGEFYSFAWSVAGSLVGALQRARCQRANASKAFNIISLIPSYLITSSHIS